MASIKRHESELSFFCHSSHNFFCHFAWLQLSAPWMLLIRDQVCFEAEWQIKGVFRQIGNNATALNVTENTLISSVRQQFEYWAEETGYVKNLREKCNPFMNIQKQQEQAETGGKLQRFKHSLASPQLTSVQLVHWLAWGERTAQMWVKNIDFAVCLNTP